MSANSTGDLALTRERIDTLDRIIVDYLQLRARYALEAAEAKRALGLPMRQPERERAILERIAAHMSRRPGPLSPCAIMRIFEAIIAETREAQERYGTSEDILAKNTTAENAET